MSKDTTQVIDLSSPAGYVKLMVYIAVGVIGTAQPLIADNILSFSDIIQLAIAAVGVLVVWQVTQAKWLKAYAALGLAGLQALALIVTQATNIGDVTLYNWFGVILAVAAAGGVAFIPNKKTYALAA